MLRTPFVVGCLWAATLIFPAAAFCDYGTLPGFWDGEEWQLVSPECTLHRYTASRSAWEALPVAHEGDNLLLIGDSFDRQIVDGTGRRLRALARDYTPAGEHEKIGHNVALRVGSQQVANLFIFGANNAGEYAEPAEAGRTQAMHFRSHDRICRDYKRYAPDAKDPYMIVLNSVLWDTMAWAMKHARKGWETGDYNIPSGLSQRMRRKNPHQVWEPGPHGRQWRETLAAYEADLTALIVKTRQCFPETKLFCWRTAPLPPTDSRTHHFWLKPPYVASAMNAIGTSVARRMGLCVIDMEKMIQGRGNDGHWVPDGSHPSDAALSEVMNVLLNIMVQHKANPVLADRYAETQRVVNLSPASVMRLDDSTLR